MFIAGDAPSDVWKCIATRLKADQMTARPVRKKSGVFAHAVDFQANVNMISELISQLRTFAETNPWCKTF